MQGTSWQPYVGQRVTVANGIAFAGGVSPWQDMQGTVRKLLTARACMVQLDCDPEHMMFFTREVAPLNPS